MEWENLPNVAFNFFFWSFTFHNVFIIIVFLKSRSSVIFTRNVFIKVDKSDISLINYRNLDVYLEACQISDTELFCENNLRLTGCLYEKKRSGHILVHRVPPLAGMILIFVYIRSFIPFRRAEYVPYCWEFSSLWF